MKNPVFPQTEFSKCLSAIEIVEAGKPRFLVCRMQRPWNNFFNSLLNIARIISTYRRWQADAILSPGTIGLVKANRWEDTNKDTAKNRDEQREREERSR